MSERQQLPRTGSLITVAVTPALAWITLLLVGSQLDENMCATGAAPHRGRWFGADVRVVIAAVAALLAIVTAIAAVTLLHRLRLARAQTGARAETRSFIATLALISLGLFVTIIVATLVPLLVVGPC